MNQHQTNLAIENLIREKDFKGETYTGKDLEFIRQYSGSGGKVAQGAEGKGILTEYYTPDWLARDMWKLAEHYGFPADGTVLEPACGTGNLIKPAPDYAKVTAFETNPVTARIVELIYPGVTVHTDYFESAFMQKPKLRSRMPGVSTWLPDAPFDLVIGNPPYGKHSSRYSGFFKKPKFTLVEHFFLYYGLQLLKPGGLLVFLTTAGWMRTGVAYQKAKEEVAKLARLENALHLPPVIEATNVPLDLLIFRRHEN